MLSNIKYFDPHTEPPLEMKTIDDTSIKICDVSDDDQNNDDDDDDDVAGAVGPAPNSKSVTQSPPQYPHLHQYHQPHSPPPVDCRFSTAATSPPHTSADGLPRTSKHSRTRAPVHQSRTSNKIDADTLLMETSLVIINQSPSPILPTVHQPHHHHHHLPHSKPTSPTSVVLPSSTNSSPQKPIQPTGGLTSPVQTPIAKHYQQIKEHQELVQKLAEQHQKHPKPMSPPQSTMSDRTAVGHFTPRSQHHNRPHPLVMPSSSSSASNELELVLSPSKLGL